MYLPKSKYSISIAKPGEYRLNGETYVGPVITTYTGAVYAGDDICNTKGTLENMKVQEFQEDGMEVYSIVPFKRVPTKAEYKAGYMTRYFCQDKRSCKIFEASKDSWEKVKANSNIEYYNFAQVKWYLTGPVALSENKKSIELLETALPGIVSSKVLYNPEQFFKATVE